MFAKSPHSASLSDVAQNLWSTTLMLLYRSVAILFHIKVIFMLLMSLKPTVSLLFFIFFSRHSNKQAAIAFDHHDAWVLFQTYMYVILLERL
jgi:hypothetical protein